MSCKSDPIRKGLQLFLSATAISSAIAFPALAREVTDFRNIDLGKILERTALQQKELAVQEVAIPSFEDIAGRIRKTTTYAPASGRGFAVDLNGSEGRPRLDMPIIVAPGTNSMTPRLSFNLLPKDGVPISITGIDVIRPCNGGELCLNDTKLVLGKGFVNQHLFYPVDDPLTQVEEVSGGFVLTKSSGEQSLFQAQKLEEKAWKVSLRQDPFGNFIAYQYDKATGDIANIHYGQRGANTANLRSVSFKLASEKSPYTVVTSKVGSQNQRSYLVEADDQLRVKSVTECGYDGATETPVCRRPISFEWDHQNASDLRLIKDGQGGETRFDYQMVSGHSVLSARTDVDRGHKIREVHFSYQAPVVTNGLFKGFAKSSRYEVGTETVSTTEFARGDMAGKILSITQFHGGLDNKGTIFTDLTLSKKSYQYDLVPGGEIPAFILSQTREEFGQGGDITASLSTREYDPKGRLTAKTDDTGSVTYSYLDDKAPKSAPSFFENLVTSERHQAKDKSATLTKTWRYGFKEGALTSTQYEERRAGEAKPILAREQWFGPAGNVVKISDANGTARFEYDIKYQSFLTGLQVQQGDKTDTATFQLDPKTGAVLQQTLMGSAVTDIAYDAFGRVVKSISSFETVGGQGKRLQATENHSWSETKEGRIAEIISVSVKGEDAPADTVTSVKIFDSFGNLLQGTEPVQDATGRPAEQEVSFQYDVTGWQKIIHHPEQGDEVQIFDRAGRLVSQQKTGYKPLTYHYDPYGRLDILTRGKDDIRYAYDHQHRLISKQLPDGKRYEFSYGLEMPKRIAAVKLPSGIQIDYAYDAKGRATGNSVRVPLKEGGSYKFDTSFGYEDGRLSQVQYPDGSILGYRYDEEALSQIAWRKIPAIGTPNTDQVVASYDYKLSKAGGHIIQKGLGNGLTEQYQWNKQGLLASIDLLRPHMGDGGAIENRIAHLGYDIDPTNNLLKGEQRLQSMHGKRQDETRSYSYDAAGKLLKAGSSQNSDLVFGKDGNAVRKMLGQGQVEFLYDAENQLIQSDVKAPRKLRKTTTYEYDHMGQRISKTGADGSVTYYINPFYEFTIRKDGRLQETRYVWDQTGRIAAFSNEIIEGKHAAYQRPESIFGQGAWKTTAAHIASKVTAGVQHFLTYEKIGLFLLVGLGLAVLSAVLKTGMEGGVAVTVLATMLTLSIAPTAEAVILSTKAEKAPLEATRFFHTDLRGSVYSVSNGSGQVISNHQYAPYGDPGVTAPDGITPRFAGHDYDAETGLYYMGSRYYNPASGQFLTPDPARSTSNPYEYANSNPISFIDPDGQAGDEVPLSRWQRFKNWTGLSNWRFFGAEDKQVIPAEWGGAPTEAEKAEFDDYHRTKSVEGWTRFGGYLQSLLIAPILAYAFPTSKIVEGVEIIPGYGVDLVVSAIRVTIFSAFGKAYTAVEALRWEEAMARGATPRDGRLLLAKRMIYKVGIQVPLFTGAAYFQRYLSEFPMMERDNLASDMGFLLTQYTLMSIFGNLVLLPYYYGSKPWSPTGDTEADYRQQVTDSSGFTGFLKKAGLAYRDFSTRREFWAEDRGGFFRNQYGWFILYVTQMYVLYHLGSLGYYSGYAIFGLIASSTSWGFDWSQYTFKWVKNIVSLQLSPASSPLALINAKGRWSMTVVREVSPLSPETGWFLSRTLGSVGGLRISKYMDSSYASDHRIVEWLIKTDRRQLIAPPAGADADGEADARIIVIEEDDGAPAREEGSPDVPDIEMQPPNVPLNVAPDHWPQPREMDRIE